jgi:polyferredoxin
MQLKQMMTKVTHWRLLIQWLFLGWCIFLGVQFALFVRHFEALGQTAYYPRPPGVEGFLPIGALVGLKAWLTSGYFDPVHPAALVLFLTFLAMALFARKSFCGWLCPVGTLSEGLWKLGRKVFGRNFRIWRWLDLLLRVTRYALLLFFVKLVLVDMPTMALQGFLKAPYWAIADIKMLRFFTDISLTSALVILLLSVLSVIYQNFWCRYLCPYGALHGLFSFFSPLRVVRDQSSCTACGACSRACPARIDVQKKKYVCSVECTGCLTCVGSCPEPDTLNIGFWKRPLPGWTFALLVVGLFAGGVMTGMLSGHWQTSLTYDDYLRLVPLVDRF